MNILRNRDIPPAIVIKLNCINGLQTARILAKYNIPVIGIADSKKHFANKTNSCERIIQANTATDELFDALIELRKEIEGKPVLFPCSDDSAYLISAQRDKICDYFHYVLPDHEILELFMNKVKFYKYAQSSGFPIPDTYFPESLSDLKKISENIKYPCIVKPPRGSKEWWKEFDNKVVKVTSPNELEEIYLKSLNVTNTPIVQEWIEGDDSNLNHCTVYYNKEHKPVIAFTSRKLRQWPIECGERSLAQEIQNEELKEHANKLFSDIPFSGIANLEMKKNPHDQSYYTIEVNVCRTNSGFKIVESGNVELLYTMYLDALDIKQDTKTTQQYRNTKWIYIKNDLLASRAYMKKGDLTYRQWFRSVIGVNCFAVLSLRDPLPFLYDIYDAIIHKLQKLPLVRRFFV